MLLMLSTLYLTDFFKRLLFVFLTETKKEIFMPFCMGERFSLLSIVAFFMWFTFSFLSSFMSSINFS